MALFGYFSMRKIILLFLLSFISINSYAAVYYYWNANGVRHATAPEACKSYVASVSGWKYVSTTYNAKGDQAYCNANSGEGTETFMGTAINRGEDYANCQSPDVPDLYGNCGPPPQQCKGGSQDWYQWGGSSSKSSICSGGCSAGSSGTQVTSSGGSAGQFTTTGQSCSGGDTATPDPGTCPAGTTNISASGPVNCTADKPEPPKCWTGSSNVSADPMVAVCVADGTPKTGPDDPNSHVPDPAKPPVTNTTSTTEKTSDGGVKTTSTTTTTTSNTDGSTSVSSETTTTITSPTGETKTTVDGNKVEDKTKDFCKLNPTLTVCRNSSVTGDCDTLSIDGDAIQGAILRQQKKEYCENQAASDIKDLGLALIANNDPMQSQFPTIDNAAVVDLSNIGNLDSSGFLGGGSCFADKSFNVGGVTVRIPISVVCDYLIPLRLAIMLLALMASYKMVAGTVLRDL